MKTTLSKLIMLITFAASLFSLFGCQKPTAKRLDELSKLSYSARCTDNNRSFSFSLRKSDSEWLLSAELDGGAVEDRKIDADEILAVVKSEKLLDKVLDYRAPDDGLEALDADECTLSFTLGAEIHHAPIRTDKLEEKFRLAAKPKE